jgi:hypothetical protein
MADDFRKFAEDIRAHAENSIKSELSKSSFLELGFRIFMPLIVSIVTDHGAVSLTISKDGSVRLGESVSANPDVTIEADFETLRSLYQSRDKNLFSQAENDGKIKMTSHGWKGQQAETRLRQLFSH